jgi:hypothetical protein
MLSPPHLQGTTPEHAGPLRFLDPSLGTRCPLPPRRAGQVLLPVASLPVLASPSLTGWPLSSWRFEAVPGSLSLRLAPCASQGFRARLPAYPACSATCLTGISHGELLSVHKRGQALPDAPEDAEERRERRGIPPRSLFPSASLRETAVSESRDSQEAGGRAGADAIAFRP